MGVDAGQGCPGVSCVQLPLFPVIRGLRFLLRVGSGVLLFWVGSGEVWLRFSWTKLARAPVSSVSWAPREVFWDLGF